MTPGQKSDLLIIGGGTGGCAAAMMACELGLSVTMTEETDWIGGQLTAQIVPPDEHPWIEQFGRTWRYAEFRRRIREVYARNPDVKPEFRRDPFLNPGSGWVSRLCFEPRLGVQVLMEMLGPHVESGRLTIALKRKPHSVEVNADEVRSVRVVNLETGEFESYEGTFVLDATELGDLLPMAGAEYVVGAESKAETGEPNAVEGPGEWDNVQGITWCFALAHDLTPGADHTVPRPTDYEKWVRWKPDFWPGPILGFEVLHAHTGVIKELPLYGRNPGDWYALFPYRQIVDPDLFTTPRDPATVVNWPQNDYFEATIMDVDPLPSGDRIPEGFEVPGAMGPESARRLRASQQLSLSLVHWLQTDAPRHDDAPGAYPGVYIATEYAGTKDGFAKYPYIREARRIRAMTTVREQDVAAYTNPGLDRAPSFADSVGVGAYRIDLHPSTNGANTIDTSTLPFEIPLGSLIPVRMKNLIPAAKNLGVTHITNGCYRLHPVEWNIGESAAALVAYCLLSKKEPRRIAESEADVSALQALLMREGVQIRWPQLRPL